MCAVCVHKSSTNFMAIGITDTISFDSRTLSINDIGAFTLTDNTLERGDGDAASWPRISINGS